MQSQNSDLGLVNQQAQSLIRQADARNRQLIEQDNAALNREWQDLVRSLEQRREHLQQLAEHWDSFENSLHGWEKALGRLEDKFRNVDPTVRSRRHLEDTKNAIQVSRRHITYIARVATVVAQSMSLPQWAHGAAGLIDLLLYYTHSYTHTADENSFIQWAEPP